MNECWFFDNNFNGISEESLDDVMDIELLDLPLDFDFDDNQDLVAEFKLLQDPPPLQSSHYPNTFSSSIVKTTRPTYGKTIPIHNVSLKGKDLLQFQTNSPVSDFESSSSSPSVENSNFQLPVIPAKRPRSKRQRLSNISLLYAIPFIFTSPAFQKCQRIAVSQSYLQTQPAGKILSMVKKKQTEKDIPLPVNKIEMKKSSSQESIAPRKCLHCEVTKTPQWREGPMGPKTLCNACGVRYRSGRLFAEYRPAASPTFIASLHSNSHKKVLEIRNRATRVTVR